MRLESFRIDPELIAAVEAVRKELDLSRGGYVRRALRLAVRFDQQLLQEQERRLSAGESLKAREESPAVA